MKVSIIDKLGKEPMLQVALDFIDINVALKAAKDSLIGGADILEVGTPLIKSCGVNAIRRLRKEFSEAFIVADMKTMDVGALEAELAFTSGANIITVLGVADNHTIMEALNVARKYDGLIMVDLMNCPNPVERAHELEEMGVDIILVHVGIDQQKRGLNPLDLLLTLHGKVKCYLAIAGGINEKTAPKAVKNGADIIIVGRAITRSSNIIEATKRIKEAILSAKKQL